MLANATRKVVPESLSYIFFCLWRHNALKLAFCFSSSKRLWFKIEKVCWRVWQNLPAFSWKDRLFVCYLSRGQQMNSRQNTRLNIFSMWLTLEGGRKMRYWTEGPDFNMRVEERNIDVSLFYLSRDRVDSRWVSTLNADGFRLWQHPPLVCRQRVFMIDNVWTFVEVLFLYNAWNLIIS